MTDALQVLLVPDADETTRQVLRVLRTAALSQINPDRDERLNFVLRWDEAPSLHLDAAPVPVRAPDGSVLYFEGALTETPPRPDVSAIQATVAPLLAFSEAVERAADPAEVHQAAVVAGMQVLDAAGALLLLPDGPTAAQVATATPSLVLPDEAGWAKLRLPRTATAIDDLRTAEPMLVPAPIRQLMEASGLQATLGLPLLHKKLVVGALWVFFEAPRTFSLDERERGGLLAHHLAMSLGPLAHETQGDEKASDTPAPRPPFADPAFRVLAAQTTDALFGLQRAPSGRLVFAWAASTFQMLTGFEPATLRDLDGLLSIVHPDDAAAVRDAYGGLTEERPLALEHRIITQDGTIRWVRHTARYFAAEEVDQEGAVRFLCALVDVTDYHKAIQEAAQPVSDGHSPLDAAFLSQLSQDLRAPLTSLLEETERLAQAGAGTAGAPWASAQCIARDGRRLMATLNLVVDLTRIEAGEVDLVRTDLDLRVEVEKVVDLLGPLASRKGLAVRQHVPQRRLVVHQDAHAVSRVLHYLVGAAIAQTDAGEIAVTLEAHEAEVALTIADTGAGALEPARGSTAVLPFGGIVAERLVTVMGGHLAVKRIEGEGTTYVLTLPLVERGVAADAEASTLAPAADTEPASVVATDGTSAEPQAAHATPGETTEAEDAPGPEQALDDRGSAEADATGESEQDEFQPDDQAAVADAAEAFATATTEVEDEAAAFEAVEHEADEERYDPDVDEDRWERAAEAELGSQFADRPPSSVSQEPDESKAEEPEAVEAEEPEVGEEVLQAAEPESLEQGDGAISATADEPLFQTERPSTPSLLDVASAFDAFGDASMFDVGEDEVADAEAAAVEAPDAAVLLSSQAPPLNLVEDEDDAPPASLRRAELTQGASEELEYTRTEVALPVGVRRPSGEGSGRPPRKEGGPVARLSSREDAPRVDSPTSLGEYEDAGPAGSHPREPGIQSQGHLSAFDTALDAFAGGVTEDLRDPPSPPRPDGQAPLHVLIVEDNEETRMLLEKLIGREFETVSVESPRAALDMLTQRQFDALVLDIHLGGRETGFDILRIARTLEGCTDIFAMAVTAYGEAAERDRYLKAGFEAYVQKPFEPNTLLGPLRKLAAARDDDAVA